MTDQRVTARTATQTDADVVAALADLARDEAAGQRGGALLLAFDRPGQRPSLALGDDEALFVGEIDGIVVGYGWLAVRREGDVAVALLNELFVHPGAREVGVAAALLERAQAHGRSQGCTHLESEVLPGNRAAKNFFERMGMVTRKMRVSSPLDEAS